MIGMMPTRYERAPVSSNSYRVQPVSPVYHAQNQNHHRDPQWYTPEKTYSDERPNITYNSRGKIKPSSSTSNGPSEIDFKKYQRRANPTKNLRGEVSFTA